MWLDAKLWVLRGNQSYMLKRLKIIAEAFVKVKREDSFPYEINDRIRLVFNFLALERQSSFVIGGNNYRVILI